MPPRSETKGARSAGAGADSPRSTLPCSSSSAPQLGKRRLEREPVAVAAVDAGHERLDERLVRLPAEAPRDERPDRLVGAGGRRRHVRLGREAGLALGREELALLERLETRRDHPGEAFGKRVQVIAVTHEAPAVLRPASDQLVREAELVAQADTALLAREEAVGRRLDDEAADPLGADLPAEHVVALDEDDLRVRSERLEAPGRGEPRDPAPHDDDPHGSAPPRRHGSCRPALR